MHCVSYNVQYGTGLDGRYDITRIADAVREADLVALQEVTRNNPRNGGRDMVAELREALPGHFAVYGPNFEADMGSRIVDGRAVDMHLQFGNMILSRTPILMSRNLLLPRRRSLDRLNLQRGALEALVDTPLGPIRFYSVHLDHRGPDERLRQIDFLMRRVLDYPREGGGLTGLSELGMPEPPHPEAFVMLGDFNLLPGSAEYLAICGHPDHEFGVPLVADRAVDAAAAVAAGGEAPATWVDPDRPADRSRWKRIDYAFVSPGLAGNVRASRVDAAATGSDHQPLWLELA